MPYMEEVADPTAYYFDSHSPMRKRDWAWVSAISLGSLQDRLEVPATRWPVHNRAERAAIGSQKRAIIHERDGGVCRICGTGGHRLVVDHIIPRSAFPPEDLWIADRSDNLISACWDCNSQKSNYESPQSKRMGVTVACWDCLNPHYDPELYESFEHDPRPETPIIAYCGQCGISAVPMVDGWII